MDIKLLALLLQAFLSCYSYQLSLKHGHYGIVKVVSDSYADGLICDNSFEDNDNACTVICKSLGYQGGLNIDCGAGTGRILMTNVNCVGTETLLSQCGYLWGPVAHSCTLEEAAACKCCQTSTCTGVTRDCPAVGAHQLLCNNTTPVVPITTSSVWDANHDQRGSCLNFVQNMPRAGSWTAGVSSQVVGQWIEATFEQVHIFTAIATQGRNGPYPQWVTSYKVLVSMDGQNYTFARDSNGLEIFAGNSDSDTVVQHSLGPNTIGRRIRLSVQAWKSYISMRWEVYGNINNDNCY